MNTPVNPGSPFVGRKVKLKESTRNFKGMDIKTYALDDPEFESELNARYEQLRIWLPGTVGTMDLKPSRTNVHIDATGLVTRVNQG